MSFFFYWSGRGKKSVMRKGSNWNFYTLVTYRFLRCSLLMRDEGRTATLLYKKYNSLYFSWSQSFCWVWERQGNKDRLLYWPITSSLDHTYWVIFKTPLSISSASRLGVLNWRPLRASTPNKALSMATSWLWLWLRPSLTPTDELASAYIIL